MKGHENQEKRFQQQKQYKKQKSKQKQQALYLYTRKYNASNAYCLHELSNEFSSMDFLTLTHGNSSAICDQKYR